MSDEGQLAKLDTIPPSQMRPQFIEVCQKLDLPNCSDTKICDANLPRQKLCRVWHADMASAPHNALELRSAFMIQAFFLIFNHQSSRSTLAQVNSPSSIDELTAAHQSSNADDAVALNPPSKLAAQQKSHICLARA